MCFGAFAFFLIIYMISWLYSEQFFRIFYHTLQPPHRPTTLALIARLSINRDYGKFKCSTEFFKSIVLILAFKIVRKYWYHNYQLELTRNQYYHMLREYRITLAQIPFKDKSKHNKFISTLRSPLDPYRRLDEEKKRRNSLV